MELSLPHHVCLHIRNHFQGVCAGPAWALSCPCPPSPNADSPGPPVMEGRMGVFHLHTPREPPVGMAGPPGCLVVWPGSTKWERKGPRTHAENAHCEPAGVACGQAAVSCPSLPSRALPAPQVPKLTSPRGCRWAERSVAALSPAFTPSSSCGFALCRAPRTRLHDSLCS